MTAWVVDINPVALSLGPVAVRWYGLAYGAGFLIGLWWLQRLWRDDPRLPSGFQPDDFLTWAVIGVVAGGRLGEVLFYRLSEYLRQPLEILMIWKGGMASHGGMAGLALAALLFARRRSINVLVLTDGLALAATPGLFLGRVANFINQEMVGAVTTVPWAVIFPAHDGLPRHPVQLYQAVTEGPLLAALLLLVPARRWGAGARTAAFMVGYSAVRFATEYFRQVDPGYLGDIGGLTNGQVLSGILAALGSGLGLWLWWRWRSVGDSGRGISS